MPYRITNRTNQTVLVRLRSGRTIHLAGGARTDDLDGAEINGNPRLSSLVERRLVTVEDAGAAPPTAAKKAARVPSNQKSRKPAATEGDPQ